MLNTMAAVERKCPKHFSERHRPKEIVSLFGFGLKFFQLPDCDMGAVARHCSKIAVASDAIVEVLGKFAAVAGEADERRRAEAFVLHLVPQAGPYGDAAAVPEELADCCSHVRVPTLAVSHVSGDARALLSSIEDETGTMTFWLPESAVAATRTCQGAVSLGSAALDEGSAVRGKYEDEWHSATLLGAGSSPGTVRVEWEFDGSSDELPVAKVRAA